MADPLEHVDDVEAALREFDEATPADDQRPMPDRQGQENRWQQRREQNGAEESQESSQRPEADPEKVSLFPDYGPLRDYLDQRDAVVLREQGRQDFERLLDKLEREPEFAAMGREFLASYLVGAAQADDRLARDWGRRNEAPHLWAHRFKKVVANLSETLKRRPDQDATDTRAVVAAAVRRGSNSMPEAKPKNWGSMSNREFNEATKEFGMGSKLHDWGGS